MSEVNIIADEVYFNGEHVATLNEKSILSYKDDFVSHLMRDDIEDKDDYYYDRGREDGYDRGREDGYEEGYDDGYATATEEHRGED